MPDRQDQGAATLTAPASASGSQKEAQPRKHRKLNRSAHQLKRNAACIPCRRRRIKCDAGRPHCASCTRSFHFLQRTNPDAERDSAGVQCFYEDEDEGEEDEAGPSRHQSATAAQDKETVVKKLEARVEELQKALLETPGPAPPVSAPQPPLVNTGWSDSTQYPMTSSYSAPPPIPASAGPLYPQENPNSMNDHNGHAARTVQPEIAPAPVMNGVDGLVLNPQDMTGIDGEAGKLGGPFVDIIWPGWPPRLPTPAMLDHLVQVFFNMVPSISRLLHRQTFQARLLLRPTHPNFPHTALLHAICAVSARYSAAVKTCTPEQYISRADAKLRETKARRPGEEMLEEQIGSEECFAERNSRYAQLEARLEDTNGRKLVDVVQAMALTCYYCQQHANWINGWMTIAQSVRAAIPLGLMRNDNGPSIGNIIKPGHSLIPPPEGDWDREERRTLMFTVLMFDINASASSGWPNMMMTDELYSRLPCSRQEFERGGAMSENTQTARSHDLFTNHPVEDSLVALLKGGILLNKVNKFVRYVKASEPAERPFMKETPEFAQLDGDIKAFIQYFPTSLRDPLKPLTGMHKGIDTDLISAHLLPHVAAIFLHEPFADLHDPSCTSAIRLSTEARACLGIIHLVTSTSLDLSYTLVPITSFYCFTAARTLLLFYQRSLEIGDYASAKILLSEVEILRMAFKALGNRFAMGVRHWGMLQVMLDRINGEYGLTPVNQNDAVVPPEPNMRARAFPSQHPDSVLTNNMRNSIESFRDVMDRRRGFVAKLASLHSESPPTATTTGLTPVHGMGQSQSQSYTSTSSPMQGNMPAPMPMPTQPPPPLQPQPQQQHQQFDPMPFGQSSWGSLGINTSLAAVADPLAQPFPDPVQASAVPAEVGFDWINWLSTANVTMMAPDEHGQDMPSI